MIRGGFRKLTKYIRLTDFLVRDTLLGLALDSAETMMSWMNPAASADGATAPSPVFQVSVGFNADPSLLAEQEAKIQRELYRKAKADREAAKAEAAANKKTSEDEEEVDDESKYEPEPVIDTIDYDAIKVVVEPSFRAVKDKVQDLLMDAVSVVSGPPPLLTHPDLSPYTQVTPL